MNETPRIILEQLGGWHDGAVHVVRDDGEERMPDIFDEALQMTRDAAESSFQHRLGEALAEFVKLCQHVVDLEYGTGDRRQILSLDPGGKRYARIVTADVNGSSRSVYCFVDLQNGDVLKSASWKAPAKGARGNILAEDQGMSRMGPYGAGYNNR